MRKRGIEDAVKLGRLYAKEERDDLREGILQLFFMGDSVSALGEEELARLMHDAESEKESLYAAMDVAAVWLERALSSR